MGDCEVPNIIALEPIYISRNSDARGIPVRTVCVHVTDNALSNAPRSSKAKRARPAALRDIIRDMSRPDILPGGKTERDGRRRGRGRAKNAPLDFCAVARRARSKIGLISPCLFTERNSAVCNFVSSAAARD